MSEPTNTPAVPHAKAATTGRPQGPEEPGHRQGPGKPGSPQPPGKPGSRRATEGAGVRGWVRDLALGLRFAVTGGRRGWVRTLLTAVGVGLGVAMLLIASSIPQMLQNRDDRADDRRIAQQAFDKRSDSTFLFAKSDTIYREDAISGVLVQPDGDSAPAPPGLAKLPGPGEMGVSPGLAELLSSPEGALLKERLPYRISATIGDSGLTGPNELLYYAGSADLASSDAAGRADGFGAIKIKEPLDGVLLLIVLIAFIALLLPVAVFISTAVRFGGEQRDRRLAALRLVGADRSMAARIAAGESLGGALLGLAAGAGFFVLGRRWASTVTVWDIAAFSDDLSPHPALTLLIGAAVPTAAVLVTLFALRGVVIEPLGVVRNSTPRTRTVWWRVLMPLVGLALLMTQMGAVSVGSGPIDSLLIGAGALMVLVGITLLLPWLVEAVVRRLDGGPVSWQLAVRRLQLSSGTAARAISGIVVAAAGAIALQVLFSSVEGNYISPTGADTKRADLQVSAAARNGAEAWTRLDAYDEVRGVSDVIATVETHIVPHGSKSAGADGAPLTALTVGDCASLRQLAKLPSCEDGDVFTIRKYGDDDRYSYYPRAGESLTLGDGDDAAAHQRWRIPGDARQVQALTNPTGERSAGVLATRSAVDVSKLAGANPEAMVRLDRGVPDAEEHVRNAAARQDPLTRVQRLELNEEDSRLAGIRTGLFVGATATMALIAVSLLVSTLEQLRERRQLLAALIAFGTRRSTLCWSVLWQTAIPIALGLTLAVVGGMIFGQVLLLMVGTSPVDWLVWLPIAGVGAGLIALITLLSLPSLWRMMRPDGLRAE
ncbi:FtsX-like permease family protein [Streptomyces sp. NPDC014894]|uniref:FtsX-like permease family protein n=1 Tax=Streptomyces sp. NPDC014894 TaxID=3364931 RepID=UPI0036FAA8DA